MADEGGGQGMATSSDLTGWLLSVIFVLFIVGSVFLNIQQRIAAKQQRGELSFLALMGFSEPLPEGTPLGTPVSVVRTTEVFDFPDGTQLGEQLRKARGRLVGGPVDGWWDVDFNFQPDGWVDGADLFIVPNTFSIGDAIEIADTTGVHASPAGLYIGPQEGGALGVITDGPVNVNGVRWVYVDFENDPDGWVLESDLTKPPSVFTVFLARLTSIFNWISLILVVLSLIGIVYAVIRLRQIAEIENKKYATPTAVQFVPSDAEAAEKNERWEQIETLVASQNPGDWKMAILEADIMLDRLVTHLYPTAGDNLGERMKTIEPSDFLTLDKAWEAHKVRNMIAHEGADFILTQREARRVIGLFEDVFREFGYL